MAFLNLNRTALAHNYRQLDQLFKATGREWGVVTKILCGYQPYLQEVLKLKPAVVFDSRLSNLRMVRSIDPSVRTAYIKPTPHSLIPHILEYADITFNTELETIFALNDMAKSIDKIHEVVIMIEMGDLREGVMRDDLLDFYEEVFNLKNIEIVGIGTNLNCLNGVMPSEDKLIQLSLYSQLIEARFKRKLKWVTAGTSVVFPLLPAGLLPIGINHFRIGETLFFGNDIVRHEPIEGMRQDIFTLEAEVLEVQEKPMTPSGIIGTNVAGNSPAYEMVDVGKTSFRALLDVGLLDIADSDISPLITQFTVEGASSDMIVINLGKNDQKIKVGDLIPFRINYMGALRLLNSNYIEKRIIE
jgi:predicted amino acid racemase